jgi:hypothetical protein
MRESFVDSEYDDGLDMSAETLTSGKKKKSRRATIQDKKGKKKLPGDKNEACCKTGCLIF